MNTKMKKFFILTIFAIMFLSGCKKAETNASSDITDLTVLSDTVAYSELTNINQDLDNHLGKMIKICGDYYVNLSSDSESFYHYVHIYDATGCCQQGFEFIWDGKHSFPDDYPDPFSKIEVTGVLDSYEDAEGFHYFLAVDDVLSVE